VKGADPSTQGKYQVVIKNKLSNDCTNQCKVVLGGKNPVPRLLGKQKKDPHDAARGFFFDVHPKLVSFHAIGSKWGGVLKARGP
jgi:hypothetical protein